MRFILILLFLFLYGISSVKASQDHLENILEMPLENIVRKADYYAGNEMPDSALIYYMFAFRKYEPEMTNEYKNLCLHSIFRSAVIYYRQPNYTKAIDMFFQAIRFCEQNHLTESLSQLYNYIGTTYVLFNDHHSSIIYFEKALALEKSYGNQLSCFNLIVNLIGSYCTIGDTSHAKIYLDELRNLDVKDSDYKQFFLNQAEAFIYKTDKEYKEAINTNLKMVDMAQKSDNNFFNIAYVYSELADIYECISNVDSAQYYFQKTYELSDKMKNSELSKASLTGLSRIYALKGNKKLSDYYNYLRLQLLDSLYNYSEFNQIKNMQEDYEMSKVEKEIMDLRHEKQVKTEALVRQYRIIFITITVLVVVIVICIVIYKQKKEISDSYRKLYEKNAELLFVADENTQMRMKMTENVNQNDVDCQDCTSENSKNTGVRKEKISEDQRTKLINDILIVVNNPDIICDSQFNQRKLAELVNSNTAYVSMIINEEYHKNFSSFINEYRIKIAQKRLTDDENYGNYTIRAISESVGYRSQNNFISAFKNITGMTPSTYQRQARKYRQEQEESLESDI